MKAKIDRFIEIVSCVLLSFMVLACIWQVFARYVLGNPSGFTEEFMRYGLIWLTMIGAPYAYGKGKHLAIMIAVKQLSPMTQLRVQWVVEIFVFIFAVFVLIIGGTYVGLNAVGQVSAALGMPMQYLYFASPISGILFLCYLVIRAKEYMNVMKVRRERRK